MTKELSSSKPHHIQKDGLHCESSEVIFCSGDLEQLKEEPKENIISKSELELIDPLYQKLADNIAFLEKINLPEEIKKKEIERFVEIMQEELDNRYEAVKQNSKIRTLLIKNRNQIINALSDIFEEGERQANFCDFVFSLSFILNILIRNSKKNPKVLEELSDLVNNENLVNNINFLKTLNGFDRSDQKKVNEIKQIFKIALSHYMVNHSDLSVLDLESQNPDLLTEEEIQELLGED